MLDPIGRQIFFKNKCLFNVAKIDMKILVLYDRALKLGALMFEIFHFSLKKKTKIIKKINIFH